MSLSEVKDTNEKYMLTDSQRGLQFFVPETIAAAIIGNCFLLQSWFEKRETSECAKCSVTATALVAIKVLSSMTPVQLKVH